MNLKPQDKLEVSRDVVEQLNDMVRSGAAPSALGQGPDMTPPGPAPNNPRVDSNS